MDSPTFSRVDKISGTAPVVNGILQSFFLIISPGLRARSHDSNPFTGSRSKGTDVCGVSSMNTTRAPTALAALRLASRFERNIAGSAPRNQMLDALDFFL
jgi:hypothetical protein